MNNNILYFFFVNIIANFTQLFDLRLMYAKIQIRQRNLSPLPDSERAFVMPSDLCDDVRYVGFVERRERKTLLSEMVERCAYVD